MKATVLVTPMDRKKDRKELPGRFWCRSQNSTCETLKQLRPRLREKGIRGWRGLVVEGEVHASVFGVHSSRDVT